MNAGNLYLGTQAYGEKFLEWCIPIKEYLNLDNGSYYNINQDGSMINVHFNHKWLELYISENGYLADPHIVHPSNMSKGFCMLLVNNGYQYYPYNDVLLYNSKNKINFSYGFTYVLKTNNDFTAFCFTTKKSNYIINKILNGTAIIEIFIKNLDKKIKSSLKNQPEFMTNVSELKGQAFFNQKGIVYYE